MRFSPRRHLLSTALIAAFGTTFFSAPSAIAQTPAQAAAKSFDIKVPAQSLVTALNELSRQTGTSVYASGDLIADTQSRPVSGKLTVEQALRDMLQGSTLEATRTPDGGFALRRAGASGSALPEVVVTASSETASGHVAGYVAKLSATGTKTDTPLIETPQSITVLTSDFIEAIGATKLTEALAYTPGVNVESSGKDSRFDWITLRGFSATSPGFYLDGMQMRRNSSTYGVWLTEPYGAERVEVLRGPSSVLYGQNTAGGMVNIVSKRPTATPTREIQLQIGDHARREVKGDFSGPIDDEGKVLYRLTGLVRNAELPESGLANDRVYIAPALTWKASSDTTLTLLSQYLNSRTGAYYGGFPIQGTLLPNPNGRIAQDRFLGEPSLNHLNNEQWMLGYLLEHRVNDNWTLRQNLRYGQFDVDYLDFYSNSGTYLEVNPGDPSDPANFRLLPRIGVQITEKAKAFTIDNQVETQLRSGDWQHTLLAGLDHQRTRVDHTLLYNGSVSSIDVYAPVYNQAPLALPDMLLTENSTTLKQTGLYLQDQIKFQGRWVATLGGRYDTADIEIVDKLNSTNRKHTDHKFSGRAGLVYLHPNGVAPYISYAESFSPQTTVNPATDDFFGPETGQQYEVGIRYQPPGRKELYSAALFELKRQNYITYDFSGTVPAPKQTGEITVQGLELEARTQPVRNLNVVAAYTWTPKADVTASSTPSEIGKQYMPVPKHQASVWSDYRFPIGLLIGAGVRYVGSHKGLIEYNPVPIPSYTVVDARIAYDLDRWNLALNATNLTDKLYVPFCDTAFRCSYGDPRRVTFTATYRW